MGTKQGIITTKTRTLKVNSPETKQASKQRRTIYRKAHTRVVNGKTIQVAASSYTVEF